MEAFAHLSPAGMAGLAPSREAGAVPGHGGGSRAKADRPGLRLRRSSLTPPLFGCPERPTAAPRRAPRGTRIAASMGRNVRLIQPGGAGGGGGGGLGGMGPQQTPYLPFMRPSSQAQTHTETDEELLDALRERRGLWHQHAPYITTLLNRGWTPAVLAEATGIQGVEQSTMVVAAQVYSTLKELGCGALDYFDVGGADVLYELRVLPVSRRKDAAEYVAAMRFDGKGARDLARAIKEHERRQREENWEAFSPSPADCMAFAFYRQSKEVKAPLEKEAALEKALLYASSESATQAVVKAIEKLRAPTPQAATSSADLSRVPLVRLRFDELFPKPLPVVGRLGALSAADLRGVGALGARRMEGPFEVFTPASGASWISLPTWPALNGAVLPAVVVVEDAAVVPALQGRKLQGPLLLVVETTREEQVENSSFYLCPGANAGLSLEAGSHAALHEERARVLALVLPPKEEAEPDEFDLDD